MSAQQPQVFIGCGGTGLGTLQRLNQLLSQDQHWRHRLGRDVYYIAIDTNQSELDEFERAVRQDCGKALPPKLIVVSLSGGYQSIWPIMNSKFVRPFSEGSPGYPEGLDRIKEHYWHNTRGEPFPARKVRVLRDGAGQCPPVSYFLAWHSLTGPLELAFHELLDSMVKRRSMEGQDPLDGVNFHVIAGLAGGTGRGCWELVSLYLRELFKRNGAHQVTPFAYLLDASCFRDKFRDNAWQEVQMKTNALTGLSQLSTWIVDRKDGEFYDFRLPSMDAPHDPDQDLIRSDREHDLVGDRPVQKAFVVCGGNSHATLDSHDEYKEMLGSALYTTLYSCEFGDSIAAQQSNQPQPLYSLGAATIEVEAVRLRKYLEEQLRSDFAERLGAPAEGGDGSASAEFVGRVMRRMRLERGKRTQDIASVAYDLLTKSSGSLGPKTVQKRLVEFLADCNDVPEAVQAARKAVGLPLVDAKRLLQEAWKKVDLHPEDVLAEEVEECLEDSGSLLAIAGRLSDLAKRLAAPQEGHSLDDKVDEFCGHVQNMGRRPWHLIGPRFDAGELESLSQEFESTYYKPVAIACLRSALQDYREDLARLANRWAANAEALAARAKTLGSRFADAAKVAGNIGADQDPVNRIFFDPARPEKALPGMNGTQRFHTRILLPKLPDNLFRLLAEDVGAGIEVTNLLVNSIQKADIRDVGYLPKFGQDLEAMIRDQLHVNPLVIQKHFSLRSVARDHAEAWWRRFKKVENDPDAFENLAHHFAQFYGFRPSRPSGDGQDFSLFPGNRVSPDTGEELLIRMGANLAAHCHSYWTIDKQAGSASHEEITLFLPAPGGVVTDDKGITNEIGVYFDDHVRGGTSTASERPFSAKLSGNQFVAVAYSASGTESFNQVQSFSYWREDHRVMGNLLAAEREDGEIVFDDTNTNGGLGFTSPIYVKNEAIARNRWRPWLQLGDDQDLSEHDRGLQALAYALFDTGVARLGSEWPLPLIAADEMNQYRFRRCELFFDEHDDKPSRAVKECLDDPHWQDGDPLGTGIHRVLAALSGERTSGGTDPEKGVQIRGRILAEEDEFWRDFAARRQYFRNGHRFAKTCEELARKCHEAGLEAQERGLDTEAEVWQELRNFYNERAKEARAES